MANEIYDSTWWGNTRQTASSIGTSTEMIQGQFNLTKIGDELVTNGDFATDSNWTKGTGSTISGGYLNHSGATASDTTQYIPITEKKYRLEYTIVSGTGSVRFWSNINAITPAKQSGVGTYVHYFFYGSSIGTNGRFAIALYDDISIDNISVKEVRATTVEASKCLADTIHRIGLQDIQN